MVTKLFLPDQAREKLVLPSYVRGDWRFSAGAGAKLFDQSRYRNHGTIEGATWSTDRKPGCLDFDGDDDYVSVPSAPSLDITTEITLEAWIKITALTDGSPKLICKPAGSGWTSPYFYYSLGAGTAITRAAQFAVITSANEIYSHVLSIGQWYHLVGTYDGSILRLYVDGVISNTKVVSGAIPTSTQPLAIGIRSTTSGGERFDGLMSGVRILAIALSASEVKARHNALK